MCGIAGILGSDGYGDRLREMLAALAHRGPDGEGIFVDPAGRAGLGHKRLAILDPAGGAQPFLSPDGALALTFNGCIYNYRELRRDLAGRGHRFRTDSDTEVLLAAYREWGEGCVSRLNGMWSFAVWDGRKGELFASRDRLGIKPFYFALAGDALVFASEIKALFASGLLAPTASETGVRQYLALQFCLGATTMFEGVERLPPGHNLRARPGAPPVVTRYWDVEYDETGPGDAAAYGEEIWAVIEDSVRLRLRADVPLGAHLSGGLDSSTVATLAKRGLGSQEVKTFTGAFRDGAAFDETEYARVAAAHAGTTYLERYFTAEDFARSIGDILWHMDEPAMGPGVFPQYLLSRLAGEHVKVVLGGQGGDELFMGYARYLVAYLEDVLRGAIRGEPAAQSGLRELAGNLRTLEQYVPMLRGFWKEGLFEDHASRYYRLMDRQADAAALLAPDVVLDSTQTQAEFREIFDRPSGAGYLNKIAYFDMKTHLQGLLQVEDRTSMAAGLESRVPLLDHRLVELLARVPPRVKLRDGKLKHLFRDLVAPVLPPAIVERTDKKGFPVPLAGWMRGELREFVGDILLGPTARRRGFFDPAALERQIQSAHPFSRALWGALNLEIWHRDALKKVS